MRLFPERRRGMRILTLKNAAWVVGGLLVLFIAYSLYNELRPSQRLFDRSGLERPTSGSATPAGL